MKGHPRERRKHTRVFLELEAELHLPDNVVYQGKIKDISFSGVYLYCANSSDIPVGENGVFKLYLQSQPGRNIINFHCRIVRTGENGVGMAFTEIDLNGYQQFKNLMVYNSSDPDKLLAELEKNPGLEIV